MVGRDPAFNGRSRPSRRGWRGGRSQVDRHCSGLDHHAASSIAGKRIRNPIAIPSLVLLVALGGCWREDYPSKFTLLGSGEMEHNTDVSLILDRKRVALPGEIEPTRAVILITIDTSSYKDAGLVHALFDLTFADDITTGERYGYFTHVDINNRSHGTITGYGPRFITCSPSSAQTELYQAPGLRRDYVLSFPAGHIFLILKGPDTDTISPIFTNRRSGVFDYFVPGFGVGETIDLGIFHIQGQKDDTSVRAGDERPVSGIMHWGQIRFAAAPMVYEITPPPIVFETKCLGYHKF
jgi:hypothetical protein